MSGNGLYKSKLAEHDVQQIKDHARNVSDPSRVDSDSLNWVGVAMLGVRVEDTTSG